MQLGRREEFSELGEERREQGQEEGDGEEVAVEEVFVPVRAVGRVCDLGVEAHDCGQELRDEEDGEAEEEGRVSFYA